MKQILSSRYKPFLLVSLVVMLVTSVFSAGYHHFDEHFQILEFCNYKLGLSPAQQLAWEFSEQIRPALQPSIAYLFANALNLTGLYTPFLLATILRVMIALLCWYATARLVVLLVDDFRTERGRKLFVLCSLFLWFVPYIGVRFSAENFAAVFLCFAIYNIVAVERGNTKNLTIKLLGAGFLLGIAWFSRIQIGFALVGIAAWILFVKKWAFKRWALMLLSFAAAVGLCVVIDHWFYGNWIFTPYNYFAVNILESKASSFGESPWWGYFEQFLMNGVPPISIVLLILFFRGVWRKPTHLFSLACIIFFLGHFFIAHKEMRFLFPLSLPFIYLASTGIDVWIEKLPYKKAYNIGFKVLVFMNVGLLIFRAFSPAQDLIKYYKFMYSKAIQSEVTLLCLEESPYTSVTLQANFYKHPNLNIQIIDSIEQATEITRQTEQPVYVYNRKMLPQDVVESNHLTRAYCSMPEWVLQFNFNDWQSRTRIGTIYEIAR